ncbi:MAG: caspase family protein [Ferruginibacter sp.]
MILNHDKTHVLMITNGRFPRWSDKDIPNVDANAEKLEAAFTDIVGIPKDNIHKLADKDSQSILVELQKIGKKCSGKDSTFIVYYAGHGVPVASSGLYWATADTELDDRELILATAISTAAIRDRLERGCNAERKILIADCCYAADFLQGSQGNLPGFIEKNSPEIKGTFFMFSSNSGSESTYPVDRTESPTYFTDALILSLQEGVEPEEEYCTVGKIFSKIVENIARLKIKYNAAIPEPDKRINGNAEDYPLYKNPKYQDNSETELRIILGNPNRDKILKWIADNPYHAKVEEAIDMLSKCEAAEIELASIDLLSDRERTLAILNYAKKYSTIIYLRSMALDKFAKEKAAGAKPGQLESTKIYDPVRGDSDSIRSGSDKMISSSPRSA